MSVLGVIVGFLHFIDFKDAQIIAAIITAFIIFGRLWWGRDVIGMVHIGTLVKNFVAFCSRRLYLLWHLL